MTRPYHPDDFAVSILAMNDEQRRRIAHALAAVVDWKTRGARAVKREERRVAEMAGGGDGDSSGGN